MEFTITLVIAIITAVVSIGAFKNEKTKYDLIFYPPAINQGQWYRFITHGFIHADGFHLIFNMVALYSFGEVVEKIFSMDLLFAGKGKLVYILLYLSALVVASVPDYIVHRNHSYYRSLGASGAVSAIIFSSILFNPTAGIGLMFIPGLHIPGYIFAILYLVISTVLAKRAQDNIGHTAHITGAIYGLVFTFVATRLFTSFDVLGYFWAVITGK